MVLSLQIFQLEGSDLPPLALEHALESSGPASFPFLWSDLISKIQGEIIGVDFCQINNFFRNTANSTPNLLILKLLKFVKKCTFPFDLCHTKGL
jgi:hypothetical protein